jgi:hypothetical protein
MSEHAAAILDAIVAGEEEGMNDAFRNAINVKVGDALDARKIHVAQSIYGSNDHEEEATDNGSEEV